MFLAYLFAFGAHCRESSRRRANLCENTQLFIYVSRRSRLDNVAQRSGGGGGYSMSTAECYRNQRFVYINTHECRHVIGTEWETTCLWWWMGSEWHCGNSSENCLRAASPVSAICARVRFAFRMQCVIVCHERGQTSSESEANSHIDTVLIRMRMRTCIASWT